MLLERVLIVDDDPLILRSLLVLFKRCSLNPDFYADAEAAYAAGTAQPFRHILCDLRMPGKDGWWLLPRLRRHYSEAGWPMLRVIVMTGYWIRGIDEHIEALNPSGVLWKPFGVGELERLLNLPAPSFHGHAPNLKACS